MKFSNDGFISEFCCPEMEIYTKKPLKAISFDLNWRKYEMADIEPKACIFTLDKSGLAVEQGYGGRSSTAGQSIISISFCPWCGQKILLEAKD